MVRAENKQPLAKRKAFFTYLDKRIPFSFWSNAVPGAAPDTVLFLGTGQIGRIPKWVAAAAPPGVAVIEGLPHWHSHPDAHDLPEFSHAYTKSAYETVLETFALPRMHVIAESQATPSTMWLVNQMPGQIGNVALLLPMGLNTSNFGETDEARLSELKRRSLRTFLQPEQSPLRDPRNLYVAAGLLRANAPGLLNGATARKHAKGISADMSEEFRALLNDAPQYSRQVFLFLGGKDTIFPADEISQALKAKSLHQPQVVVVPEATHASLAAKASRQLLQKAVEAVRSRPPSKANLSINNKIPLTNGT